MPEFAQIIAKMDFMQLIAIGAMMWFMYTRLDAKIDKLELKIEKLDLRLSEMERRLNDIDKRLFAVETMLHMKDCCMLKDDRISKMKSE